MNEEQVEKIASVIEHALQSSQYFTSLYNGRSKDASAALRDAASAAVAAMPELAALVAERDRYKSALEDLASWFTTPQVGGQVWLIPAGVRGADDAVNNARAALAQGGEK